MKNLIIDKLLNDKVLNKDEILYICHNLSDNNKEIIPYDHSSNNLSTAIGLKGGISCHDYVTESIRKFIESASKESQPATSMIVELCEAHTSVDQLFVRGVIASTITLMAELSMQKSLVKTLLAAKSLE